MVRYARSPIGCRRLEKPKPFQPNWDKRTVLHAPKGHAQRTVSRSIAIDHKQRHHHCPCRDSTLSACRRFAPSSSGHTMSLTNQVSQASK